MSKPELIRLIEKENKGVDEAKTPLSILYRKLLFDLGITPKVMLSALERWINDPRGPVKQTQKKRSQARGNYIKKFNDPKMTWKSFMDLILMHYPSQVEIIVRPKWSNGTITEHKLMLDTSYLVDGGTESSHLATFLNSYPDVDIDADGNLNSVRYDHTSEVDEVDEADTDSSHDEDIPFDDE